jgi:hypothetical protein
MKPHTSTSWSQAVTRRTFLRGATVSLALPWLESLPLRSFASGEIVKAPEAAKPPVRFACIYFSNGVEPSHWWAKGSGKEMELGNCLEPIKPLSDEILFLRGLYNQKALAHKSPHLGRISNLLSGGWVSTDQNDIRCGKTMDQLMAQHIGERTPIPSLVLGVEPTEMRLEDGLSMLYGSCISWSSETKPAMKEIYPARVFDLLIGDPAGRRHDRSILDEVMDDAKDLQRRIASADSKKLDEYLESIRDVEKRIDRAKQDGRLEGWHPSLTTPDMPRPGDSLPQNVPEHMKLMLDLIVLAFRMDKTRIATCMLNNDLSQMNFGFIEGVQGALHLDLTHNGHDPKREAMYLKTNQYHVQQFAYLINRLKAIDEGERSLLGNSILLFCSNLFDGDRHQADEMPMLLAGHAGGALKTGRILDYLERGNDERRACSLYLTIMDRMGVKVPHFGDADRLLTDV